MLDIKNYFKNKYCSKNKNTCDIHISETYTYTLTRYAFTYNLTAQQYYIQYVLATQEIKNVVDLLKNAFPKSWHVEIIDEIHKKLPYNDYKISIIMEFPAVIMCPGIDKIICKEISNYYEILDNIIVENNNIIIPQFAGR